MMISITACNDEKSNSGYAVNFHCDVTYSPNNQASSFGQFITVRKKSATDYYLTDATGKQTIVNLSESEARSGFYYGLGGLIIGTPSLCDGTIWAYDLSCPVCDRAKYRLTLSYDGTGRATCENCGNIYDLNSGGILIEGNGRSLWHYNVIHSGSIIHIQN